VPAGNRAAFGQVVVSKSLNTTSKTEAERLEKQHDVEFERRLSEAREVSNPEAVAMSIADRVRIVVYSPNSYRYASAELAENAVLTAEQYDIAEAIIGERIDQRLTQAGNMNVLLSDRRIVLPSTLLDPEVWQRCREDHGARAAACGNRYGRTGTVGSQRRAHPGMGIQPVASGW